MGILTHDHPLIKDKPESPHVDSYGTPFGEEDHKVAAGEFEWPEDTNISKPIQHKHRHIEEAFAETTKALVWRYKPPSRQEAERPVGVRRMVPVATRSSSIDDDDEQDFPV